MNTSDIISKIIIERSYANCPEWLLGMIDYNAFIQMTDNMGEMIISYNTDESNNYKPMSDEYKGLINIIQNCSRINGISTRGVIKYLASHNPLVCGIPYIAAYYLTKQSHWALFIKIASRTWSDMGIKKDTITRVFTAIASMSQNPSIAFDAILTCERCDVMAILPDNVKPINASKPPLLSYDDILPKTGHFSVDYANQYMKTILDSIMKKFGSSSADSVHMADKLLSTIWNKGIRYFPDNGTAEEALIMINIFSDNDSNGALPNIILKHVESYITKWSSEGNIEAINDLVGKLLQLAKNNINNTKFLHCAVNLNLSIGNKVKMFITATAIHMVTSGECKDNPLYDFKSLCGDGNKCTYTHYILTNINLQREFIVNGGLVSSLLIDHLHAKSQYLYDTANLPFIVQYAQHDDLKKLLLDEGVLNLIINYVVGKQPMYPVIRKLIEAGVDLVKEGHDEISKLLVSIESKYPIRDEDDLDMYRLMIANNLPFILLHRFKKYYADVTPYLPIYVQNYDDYIHMVARRNCYVPVNFGIVDCEEKQPTGLENYMNFDQIKSLVSISWGYVGDIHNPDIGKKLIGIIKIWEAYQEC